MMAERNLTVDHVTIWRWVQCYAPELNRRCRPELRVTNRSWRVDENLPSRGAQVDLFIPSGGFRWHRDHWAHLVILAHG
jgi:hypothetical protein